MGTWRTAEAAKECTVRTTRSTWARTTATRRGLVATVALLATGLSTPPAAVAERSAGGDRPSARADTTLDVTLAGQGVHVRTGSCIDVPFVVRHDGGYLDRFTAEVEVWRGPQFVTDTFDYLYDSSGPLRGSFEHCVNEATDLGTFRLGPTKGEFNLYDAGWEGTYTDSSVAVFKILQHSRLGRLRVARSGRTRTATATLTYFDAGVDRFRAAPRGTRVVLQRQLASGSWKTITAGRVGRQGRVAVSVRASRAWSYRLVFRATARTWGAVSSVARR